MKNNNEFRSSKVRPQLRPPSVSEPGQGEGKREAETEAEREIERE